MGGILAKASAEGHRTVVVFATRGELGERPEGIIGPDEDLGERRKAEAAEAARILGVHRLEFLGYRDSGMAGSPGNDDPHCFWRADVEEAASRLAVILVEEGADVFVTYDDHGVTGHPDHIQTNRVGLRAAELAGVSRVYEGTMNRDKVLSLAAAAVSAGLLTSVPNVDREHFGSPQALITTTIDVRAYLDLKRQAIAAHATQVSETSIFLALPPAAFAELWGEECAIRRGGPPDHRETTLFGDV